MLKMSTNRIPKMNFRKGIELGSELFLLLWFAFGIGTSTCDSRGKIIPQFLKLIIITKSKTLYIMWRIINYPEQNAILY